MLQLPLRLLQWMFRRKCAQCGQPMSVESGVRGRWACPMHSYYGRPYMTKFEEFLFF